MASGPPINAVNESQSRMPSDSTRSPCGANTMPRNTSPHQGRMDIRRRDDRPKTSAHRVSTACGTATTTGGPLTGSTQNAARCGEPGSRGRQSAGYSSQLRSMGQRRGRREPKGPAQPAAEPQPDSAVVPRRRILKVRFQTRQRIVQTAGRVLPTSIGMPSAGHGPRAQVDVVNGAAKPSPPHVAPHPA